MGKTRLLPFSQPMWISSDSLASLPAEKMIKQTKKKDILNFVSKGDRQEILSDFLHVIMYCTAPLFHLCKCQKKKNNAIKYSNVF